MDDDPTTVAPPSYPESDETEVCVILHKCMLCGVKTRHDLIVVKDNDDEAIDSRSIPGWEKIDRLAKDLLKLEGLCVTHIQAEELKVLHSKLLQYV